MKKKLLLYIIIICFSPISKINAQTCFGNFAGADINLACNATCTNFIARIPEIRSTENYTVSSIPYNPYPFTTGAPALTLACANQDDKFFPTSNLPFTFCFFGQSFNAMVVGTNGLITFDLSNSLNCNQYSLTGAAGPIPFSGTGSQCGTSCPTPSGVLYPRASIMGVYHDIDIDNPSPNKKMEFRVEGTAPCRRAIISFNEIPYFSCTSLTATHEIVIYETTGKIEVYVRDKPQCGWNGSAAILGIQDWSRTNGLAPPGRNLGTWGTTGMNEAWQFVPNGASSLLDHVELYLNGVFVANGTIGALNNGLYDVDFGNICPPAGTNNYVVRGYYKVCNDNSSPINIIEDTVQINRTSALAVNTSITGTTCGASTGSITITPTSGTAPYTYILNGGTPVTVPGAHTYNNLPAGSHVVVVSDVNNCDSTINFIINTTTTISATFTTTATTCPLSTNGTITVTPTSGTAPYMYSLDGGPPQASNTFTNVTAGPHTVTFTDAMNCAGSINVNVAAGTTTLTATIATTQTTCPLATDGTITVNPTNGTAPYSYSLDGGAPQAGNVFTNVSSGPHTITLRDAVNGCIGNFNVNVPAGNTAITATTSTTPTTCPTLNDGTITINPTSGTPAYQYRLNGGPPQGNNVFTNVAAGTHTVSVTDNFGCTGTFSVTVAQGSSLTSSIVSNNPPCANVNDGSITINPTSGTAPYTYSLNGGPGQASNTFTGLPAGTYTISFIDANGCTGTNSVTLTTNPAITATAALTNLSCNGNNTGSITLNPAGGVAPYEYSINGGATYQASSTFNGLTAGTHNFLIRDALGCIYNFSFSLTEPPVLSASALTGFATCPNNDGSINITAGGGTPVYEYSINNGVNYQPGNVFSNLASGNYNIRVRDANGCITNTSAVVVLNDTMRLDLGADSTICFGTSITLIPQTNALTDTFKWTPAATLNYDTARTPIASPTDTTKYYLTAKWGVCTRTDSVTVNVLHKPIPFAGADTTICYKTNALLRGSATNLSGTVNYAWTPADSLNTPNAATTIARIDTTRTFYLTVTDNYGCNFSVVDSMTVFMQPQLVVFAGNDTNAILNRPHQLLATGGVNYVWSPAGPLNNPFIANPLATLSHDTYFTVQVTDAVGCTDDDDVFIKVYEGPMYYLPNAFSPNGDGLNDIFFPVPVGIRSTEYFRVFNRYGQVMFETREWMKGWDGTLKGKPAQSGTYVWMIKGIDKNGAVLEMKGTVILLR